MNKISINHNFNNILQINASIVYFIDKRQEMYYIDIPSFNINTYAKNIIDVKIAIKEALTCFFMACKLHGQGIEKELEMMNWKPDVQNNLPVFDACAEYEFVGKNEPNKEYLQPGATPDKISYSFSIDLER